MPYPPTSVWWMVDPKKAMTLRTDPRKDYFHIVMPMQMD